MTHAQPDDSGPVPKALQRIALLIETGPFEGHYVTKVLKCVEGGFRAYAPSFRASVLPIPVGHPLRVHFTHEGEHYDYPARIEERYPGPIPMILVSPPKGRVQAVQRREYHRMAAGIAVHVEPHAPLPSSPVPGPPCEATTVNLSLGGVLLESPELYPEGALLDLTLALPDDRPPLTLRTEVLRDSGRSARGPHGGWFLATEFTRLDQTTHDRIAHTVYLLQRVLRQDEPEGEAEGE
ncbi:MAG: PilZ domain-containing protein [Gemmatimonadota bacterium]|jgi:c-di-GMP-binding flagellar brake protein YcgR|nr:PilZ domain-containing protein [Gemmatimonadota bacterium]